MPRVLETAQLSSSNSGNHCLHGPAAHCCTRFFWRDIPLAALSHRLLLLDGLQSQSSALVFRLKLLWFGGVAFCHRHVEAHSSAAAAHGMERRNRNLTHASLPPPHTADPAGFWAAAARRGMVGLWA